MKFFQGALIASLSTASLSAALDATRGVGRGRRTMDAKSAKDPPEIEMEHLVGIDDEAGYAEVVRMFVGINPLNGIGSGFPVVDGNEIRNGTPRITDPNFPNKAPDSNDGRNNMCTCDCNPSPDGIG